MLQVIKEVITKWDPIGLMEFAPYDEYYGECLIILNELTLKQETLGRIIYRVFKNNFGEVFQADLKKCIEIATEIESQTN